METKICKKCGLTKELEEFRIRHYKERVYYINECKQCEKDYAKQYRENNHNVLLIKGKKWRDNNKNKIKIYNKKYKKDYYIKNKEIILNKTQKYYYDNLEKSRKDRKNYYNKNKKELVKRHYIYTKERLKRDEIYCFKCKIRNVIRCSFGRKGMLKNKKTEEILGIKLEAFYQYLLKTYKDNYGYEWDEIQKVHIDHIVPLSTATTEEEVIRLCHYTNLQLLKAKDNLHKGSKENWKLGD